MALKFGASDYPNREMEACQRVLIELLNILKEFKDHFALVGGWVPYYLIPDKKDLHIGTLDVDICFDFQFVTGATYATILEILQANGYYQTSPSKPFQWWKDVQIDDGKPISVEVDLLAAEYGGTGKSHENQNLQDVKARKARGSDLIFDDFNRYIEVTIEGALPGGALDTVKCKVAGVVPFLVMKGMAIGRGKPKDGYDIEFVIKNYPGGLEAIVKEFEKDQDNPLIKEGLGKIRTKFETPNHTGPDYLATFDELKDPEDRAARKRAAFEVVSELLDALNVEKFVD